jgi:hypothetical protein
MLKAAKSVQHCWCNELDRSCTIFYDKQPGSLAYHDGTNYLEIYLGTRIVSESVFKSPVVFQVSEVPIEPKSRWDAQPIKPVKTRKLETCDMSLIDPLSFAVMSISSAVTAPTPFSCRAHDYGIPISRLPSSCSAALRYLLTCIGVALCLMTARGIWWERKAVLFAYYCKAPTLTQLENYEGASTMLIAARVFGSTIYRDQFAVFAKFYIGV